MSYAIKEMFYSLQGEGARAGRPAVFIRFAGCNYWSGREDDRNRGTASCSKWCDTNFVGTDGDGGGRFDTAEAVASSARALWPSRAGKPYAVCTGGEPSLQLDGVLVEALHQVGFEVAVETNGSADLPDGVDWVCVSPKAGTGLHLREGDELKVVFPQLGMDLSELESLQFAHFFLQPLADDCTDSNVKAAVEYCLANPVWRLSVQLHKQLGLP
ncbi:MAG: 7-carboxy-7-deazaguanine synthase [Myxococcaceae bacterium]